MIEPLIEFLEKNKGTGTTSALATAAEKTGGYLVVATIEEAQKRARNHPGLEVFSLEELMDPESAWLWKEKNRAPVFFDPLVIETLARLLKERTEG